MGKIRILHITTPLSQVNTGHTSTPNPEKLSHDRNPEHISSMHECCLPY